MTIQTVVIKSADEERNSSTVAADTELFVPLTTGTYRVRGLIVWTATEAASIRVGMRVSGSTIVWAGGKASGTKLSTAARPLGAFRPSNLIGTQTRSIKGGSAYPTGFAYLWIDLMLDVTGDGTLEFIWAQKTTSASNPAIVKAGSQLVYDRTDALPHLTLARKTTDTAKTVNVSPEDVTELQITLAANTAYAVEACLIANSAATYGRFLLGRLVCTSDFTVAHTHIEFCMTDTISVFTDTAAVQRLVFANELAPSGAPTWNFYSGDAASDTGLAHYVGHIVMGDSPGTLKIQVGRTGVNSGGSVSLSKESWLTAEELPNCAI